MSGGLDVTKMTPRERARRALVIDAFAAVFIGFSGWAYLPSSQVKGLPFSIITNSHLLSILFGVFLILFAIALFVFVVYTWIKNDVGNFKKDYKEEN